MEEERIYEILSVVEEIPEGSVATYGQIARLIGRERNARLVGRVLSMASYYGSYPCHRVVNRRGELCAAFLPLGRASHRLLLEMEGVPFLPDGRVDLPHCLWDGTTDCGAE